jgi:hypothetical protein
MKIAVDTLLNMCHIALDEVRIGADDDFGEDLRSELRQCLLLSGDELVLSAPAERLMPQPVVAVVSGPEDYDAIRTEYTDGHGSLIIPNDFLRLYELRLRSWQGTVRTLLDSGSEQAKMQYSRWTRGTPQKPMAMQETDGQGRRVITYWTAGRYSSPQPENVQSVYDHWIERFTYLPQTKIIDEAETSTGDTGETTTTKVQYLVCALTDDSVRNLIYRAVSKFLISKKESTVAEQMQQLSTF